MTTKTLAKKISDKWLEYMKEAIADVKHPPFDKVIEPLISEALLSQRREIIEKIDVWFEAHDKQSVSFESDDLIKYLKEI